MLSPVKYKRVFSRSAESSSVECVVMSSINVPRPCKMDGNKPLLSMWVRKCVWYNILAFPLVTFCSLKMDHVQDYNNLNTRGVYIKSSLSFDRVGNCYCIVRGGLTSVRPLRHSYHLIIVKC